MVEQVKEYVRSYDICQKTKERNNKVMGELGSKVIKITNPNWIFELVGPIPTNEGTPFILNCVDNASRYVMLEMLRKMNTEIIITKLNKLFT